MSDFWQVVIGASSAMYLFGFIATVAILNDDKWPRGWRTEESVIARLAVAVIWPAFAAGATIYGLACLIRGVGRGVVQLASRVPRPRRADDSVPTVIVCRRREDDP